MECVPTEVGFWISVSVLLIDAVLFSSSFLYNMHYSISWYSASWFSMGIYLFLTPGLQDLDGAGPRCEYEAMVCLFSRWHSPYLGGRSLSCSGLVTPLTSFLAILSFTHCTPLLSWAFVSVVPFIWFAHSPASQPCGLPCTSFWYLFNVLSQRDIPWSPSLR